MMKLTLLLMILAFKRHQISELYQLYIVMILFVRCPSIIIHNQLYSFLPAGKLVSFVQNSIIVPGVLRALSTTPAYTHH